MKNRTKASTLCHIKLCMWIMIMGLGISGITAFPIETELRLLTSHFPQTTNQYITWIREIYQAVKHTNQNYPYLSYGTDWLAFAHIMLAILFIGPLKNPVKNVWVIQFGITASIGIFALAFIAGPIRGIPLCWTLIDCSFGIVALPPLIYSYRLIKVLARNQSLN